VLSLLFKKESAVENFLRHSPNKLFGTDGVSGDPQEAQRDRQARSASSSSEHLVVFLLCLVFQKRMVQVATTRQRTQQVRGMLPVPVAQQQCSTGGWSPHGKHQAQEQKLGGKQVRLTACSNCTIDMIRTPSVFSFLQAARP